MKIKPNPNKSSERLADDMRLSLAQKDKTAIERLCAIDPEIGQLVKGKKTIFDYWCKFKKEELKLETRLCEIEQAHSELVKENAAKLKTLMNQAKKLEKNKLVKIDYKYPIKPGQIKRALRTLCVKSGDTIFVHSSLSGLGYIEHGIDGIIAELRQTVGKRGTLAMPVFSQNYPAVVWEAFDPKKSLSTAGRITERFWRMPSVLRSDNPCHSIAAIGPRAQYLTAPHGNWDMFDRKGPFGRLYDLDAKIIMLGCGMANTLLHAVEAWALPYMPPNFIFARTKNGRIKKVVCQQFPEWHRQWYGKGEKGKIHKQLLDKKVIMKYKLGRGIIYGMSAKNMVDTSLRILQKEPDILLCDSPNCCTCWPSRAMLVGWKVPSRV